MRAPRNNKVKIFLTVFLVYLFYIAPGYITANTNRFVDLTKAIIDDHTFNIDRYHANTIDKSFYKGHYYVGGAPGLGLMAAPIYIALKPFLKLIPENIYSDTEFNILTLFFAFFLAVFPGTLIAFLLYDILLGFNLKEKERILTVIASSFGTILFFYSTKFMAHIMGALMLFGAFYILFRFKNTVRVKRLYFLAGLCLGMAPLLEYMLAIGSLLIMVYAFHNFRKSKILYYAYFILGVSLPTFIFMYYHYKCFDNPFALATAYSQMIGEVPMGLPQSRIIYGLTFGKLRGLFAFMPILLVSLYGIFVFFKNPEKQYLPEMLLVSFFSLSLFFVFAVFCNKFWPTIGEAFGPRHLISCIPFLMISLAFAYKKIKYKIVLWIAAVSIFINWCGIQYGDADSAFINIGLFIFRGLNSNMAEWGYKLTNAYIRKLNVITHFSPLMGLVLLSIVIYMIWKKEIEELMQLYFCRKYKA